MPTLLERGKGRGRVRLAAQAFHQPSRDRFGFGPMGKGDRALFIVVDKMFRCPAKFAGAGKHFQADSAKEARFCPGFLLVK